MTLQNILGLVKGPDKGKILLLMGLLLLTFDEENNAKELITEGFKYDQETVSLYLDEQAEV